jgi:hypothetical protein
MIATAITRLIAHPIPTSMPEGLYPTPAQPRPQPGYVDRRGTRKPSADTIQAANAVQLAPSSRRARGGRILTEGRGRNAAGADLSGHQSSAHFAICPNRPAASGDVERRGRNSKPSADAHRGGECSAVGGAVPGSRLARCVCISPTAGSGQGLEVCEGRPF